MPSFPETWDLGAPGSPASSPSRHLRVGSPWESESLPFQARPSLLGGLCPGRCRGALLVLAKLLLHCPLPTFPPVASEDRQLRSLGLSHF